MIPLFGNAWRAFLDILFPPLCVVCGAYCGNEPFASVCARCLSHIVSPTAFFCPVCRARLPVPSRAHHTHAPYLLGSLGSYDDPTLQRLIHALKYDGVRGLAEPLGIAAARALTAIGVPLHSFLVVPIPLHARRARKRGFNQAALLADALAQSLFLPLSEPLIRRKDTESQTAQKTHDAREHNVASCFSLRDRDAVRGHDVLLVDDVSTSGATMREAARTLKAGGARTIIAFVIAHAS